MPHANGAPANGTRAIALVGPAGAGKTSLAEAMLHAAGATDRHGSVGNGTSIGDSSPEARSRGGSTELNLYNFDYLGDHFALIDCPGSIGFAADGARGIAVADLAARMTERGVVRFLYTDIGRDGALTGPNLAAYRSLRTLTSATVIASGGVASMQDILDLAGTGVEGVVVGRALYTGAIALSEALAAVAGDAA